MTGVEFLIDRGYGALWDEPGAGKTAQAIVAARNLGGPILVVCPNMLKRWWKREILQLYPREGKRIVSTRPGGKVKVIDRGSPYETQISFIWDRLGELRFPRWTICHYAGVRIAKEYYGHIPWNVVILDEAHYIKNRKTQRSKAVHEITPLDAYRIELTATPFSKNPADLWSQLRWLGPEVKGLTSYWRFQGLFVESETQRNPVSGRGYRKFVGAKNLDILAQVMSTYGLQRTKKEIAPELPDLVETTMPLELEGRQGNVYEALMDEERIEYAIRHTGATAAQPTTLSVTTMSGEPTDIEGPVQPLGTAGVEAGVSTGPKITGIIIKNVLSRMIKGERWLSCPWKYDPGVKGAKLEWLLGWAKDYPFPAVVVTRFKDSAWGVQKALYKMRKNCISTRPICGDAPVGLRGEIIREWQMNRHQFLVGTIHTMGTGLNLDRAHQMICYDQVYDPILMTQVRERIHRITTDHPVEVVYLCVEDTSNEIILEAFKNKWKVMELVKAYLRQLQGGGELSVGRD